MKKRSFLAAFVLAVFIILPILFFSALSVYPTAVCFAEENATVYLPENRFADFLFEHSVGSAVIITVSNLDDRLDYKTFDRYIVLKTRSGEDVPYHYQPLDSAAIIGFTLGKESVFLTLKEELNELPAAERSDPVIDTDLPLRVDPDSYIRATSSVRSGKITLSVTSRAENETLMTRASSYFEKNKLTVANANHFELDLRLKKVGSEESEPLYFGGEGNNLKVRIELPDYNKKYGYVLLSDLGAQGVSVKVLTVTEIDGYAYTEAELARNGSFSVVAYRKENFPPWAIALTVCGGMFLIGGGALLSVLLKKRGAKNKTKKADAPVDQSEENKKEKDPESNDKESQNKQNT